MCGRYNFEDNADTQALMDALCVTHGRYDIPSLFNIAPTEDIPVIAEEHGVRTLRPMRWWLTPAWSKAVSTQYSMFNARSETLENSKAFQASFRHHRIIVPMTSFIEWRKEGNSRQPYCVRYESDCMAAAGIWSQWTDGETILDTCAIITAPASEDFKGYHTRQPLLFNHEQANLWLTERVELKTLRALLTAPLPQNMHVHAIESSINNSRNKQPPRALEYSEGIVVRASVDTTI